MQKLVEHAAVRGSRRRRPPAAPQDATPLGKLAGLGGSLVQGGLDSMKGHDSVGKAAVAGTTAAAKLTKVHRAARKHRVRCAELA